MYFLPKPARAHLIESPPIFNADYGYKSWEAYSNLSYYTRTLPPVPHDCPTPMGVAGEPLCPQTCFLTFLTIHISGITARQETCRRNLPACLPWVCGREKLK